MPQTIAISPVTADKGVGLQLWMQRVVDRAGQAREAWDAESVHDLRVALRRCRAMAEALSQVNPDPGWRRIKKSSRDLFRELGALRDTQVEREWARKLAPSKEPIRMHLLRVFSRREKEQRKTACKALDGFSLKEWKKLSRKLERKTGLFPLESIVFQRLALANIDETAGLLARARKSRSGAAWHRARISLKHFRYLAENFLPRRYAPCAGGVKRLQDLLGEMHDLDVLRHDLRRNSSRLDSALVAAWMEKIHAERKTRLAEAVAKISGGALLVTCRLVFQLAHTVPSESLADEMSRLNRRTA
jgi:phosphohistidine phosphatase